MKIIACIKRVPTTDAQAKITPDGQSLDAAGFQYMTSFYDEIAVEQAILTKEALEGEVTVLTIGPSEVSKEVRECIAKGADGGVILVDPEWASRDALSTAKTLAAQLTSMGAELAFFGKVATDRDNGAVGPMVATLMGWACVTSVVELDIKADGGTAKRETENGMETVEFSLPAIITCDKGLNEPRYAGLKGIMAAKKKPLLEIPVDSTPNQAQVTRLELPAPRSAGRIVGEGADAVPALIDALRNEAKVL
ncbi:MAG: electron transfer flavoprotein subunit beta/FixA family protein [bacterium]|jgi:electron transfer flavoprotein beta subunit|nr:electron transfer flavoprotein subunit beta/FixA family protein [Planctomycetota bacterium]HIL52711.1 electron transfer flavoprotein subunit beta/FixA family protein [Planctomycetota bacterium]